MMHGTIALSAQVRQMLATLGMDQKEFAAAVQTDTRTVRRWLADETYPQHGSRDKLLQIEALVRRLDESFDDPEGPTLWLHTPSGYFGGLQPLDALTRGRIDLVEAALDAIDAGVFV